MEGASPAAANTSSGREVKKKRFFDEIYAVPSPNKRKSVEPIELRSAVDSAGAPPTTATTTTTASTVTPATTSTPNKKKTPEKSREKQQKSPKVNVAAGDPALLSPAKPNRSKHKTPDSSENLIATPHQPQFSPQQPTIIITEPAHHSVSAGVDAAAAAAAAKPGAEKDTSGWSVRDEFALMQCMLLGWTAEQCARAIMFSSPFSPAEVAAHWNLLLHSKDAASRLSGAMLAWGASAASASAAAAQGTDQLSPSLQQQKTPRSGKKAKTTPGTPGNAEDTAAAGVSITPNQSGSVASASCDVHSTTAEQAADAIMHDVRSTIAQIERGEAVGIMAPLDTPMDLMERARTNTLEAELSHGALDIAGTAPYGQVSGTFGSRAILSPRFTAGCGGEHEGIDLDLSTMCSMEHRLPPGRHFSINVLSSGEVEFRNLTAASPLIMNGSKIPPGASCRLAGATVVLLSIEGYALNIIFDSIRLAKFARETQAHVATATTTPKPPSKRQTPGSSSKRAAAQLPAPVPVLGPASVAVYAPAPAPALVPVVPMEHVDFPSTDFGDLNTFEDEANADDNDDDNDEDDDDDDEL